MQLNCNFCSAAIFLGNGGHFNAGGPSQVFSLVELVINLKMHNQEATKKKTGTTALQWNMIEKLQITFNF